MGAPMSQFDRDVLEVVHAIEEVEDLMRKLGIKRPTEGQWKVPGEDCNLVDIDDGAWVKAEMSETISPGEYFNPITDWVALFNPYIIDGFLQMMRDHIRGLEELRFENPELTDQLSVSRAVLGVARRLQSYVVSDPQTFEDGTRRTPERRLGSVEW